jgi:hypothetical protein
MILTVGKKGGNSNEKIGEYQKKCHEKVVSAA